MTLDSRKASGAIVPVLLLQLFAASSGFAVPARRGHYDLLLTSGYRREWIALMHWWTSIAPGIATWLMLAAVEAVASRGLRTTLLTSGTCAAMTLVSTLPWALTTRLPRFSGGIGWLLLLATSTTVVSVAPAIPATTDSFDPATLMRSAWSFLIYPPTFVGHPLSPEQVAAVAPALTLAVAAMVLACRWIVRASVPLEAAQ
jgi:hypothetical protein